MAWQGDIPDAMRGGTRRIFIIRVVDEGSGKPVHLGVGERHALTELRRVPNGSKIYFACRRERETGKYIAGKKQTIWEFDGPFAEQLLDHPVPVSPVSAGAAASEPPPASDDDIPF